MIWFCKKEKIENGNKEDEYNRIIEIKARISSLRSSLGRTEESNQNTQIQPQRMVVPEKQLPNADDKRNKELEDIKAKLLGRKK